MSSPVPPSSATPPSSSTQNTQGISDPNATNAYYTTPMPSGASVNAPLGYTSLSTLLQQYPQFYKLLVTSIEETMQSQLQSQNDQLVQQEKENDQDSDGGS